MLVAGAVRVVLGLTVFQSGLFLQHSLLHTLRGYGILCAVMRTSETSKMLTIRLNKLIGQMNGIKKMIEDGVSCEDVMTQLNAVNGGLHKLSYLMLDAHVRHCVREGMEKGDADETIESLAEALESFSKMA